MQIVTVVVTYNSREVIGDCLDSVVREKLGPVVVVDNGSQDRTAEFIKTQYKRCQIVTLAENTGYAKGNNLGIEKALALRADYVLILNPDVVLERNCIRHLLMHVEAHVSPRIVGPKIFKGSSRLAKSDSNGRVLWSAGGKLDANRYTAKLIGVGENDKGQYDQSAQVDFISGTCMFIPRAVLDTGLRFYEPYFMYYEDVEFCVKAAKLGFPSIVEPEAKISHLETSEMQKSPRENKKSYYLARNHLMFVERNAPWRIKGREVVRLPKTLWEHYSQTDTLALRGIRDYLSRRFGAYEN